MPIYAYRCAACGHELDALQKLSDAPLVDCPACGAASLKKQITAAAFRLKGAGWYETDFKQDGKKNLHEEGEQPKEKAADGDKKTDEVAKSKVPAGAEHSGEAGIKPVDSKPKPTLETKPKPAASSKPA